MEQKLTIFARAIRRARWDVWLSQMATRLGLRAISPRWKNTSNYAGKSMPKPLNQYEKTVLEGLKLILENQYSTTTSGYPHPRTNRVVGQIQGLLELGSYHED
jgi:hypothetical protein